MAASECGAQGGKVKKVLDLLELELQGLESPLTWVFGTKHRLSAILTTEASRQVEHRNFKKKKLKNSDCIMILTFLERFVVVAGLCSCPTLHLWRGKPLEGVIELKVGSGMGSAPVWLI